MTRYSSELVLLLNFMLNNNQLLYRKLTSNFGCDVKIKHIYMSEIPKITWNYRLLFLINACVAKLNLPTSSKADLAYSNMVLLQNCFRKVLNLIFNFYLVSQLFYYKFVYCLNCLIIFTWRRNPFPFLQYSIVIYN